MTSRDGARWGGGVVSVTSPHQPLLFLKPRTDRQPEDLKYVGASASGHLTAAFSSASCSSDGAAPHSAPPARRPLQGLKPPAARVPAAGAS